jgi:hypothetical protein
MSGALAVGTAIARRPAQIPESGTTVPPLALSHAIVAVGAYNTVSTTVSAYFNVANLAIAVLQLEATPAAARRRYMAVAG